MNETPLGFEWPSPKVRLARTKEAIDIIKSLWKEEEGKNNENRFVTYNGAYYHIHNAKLYTPPVSHHIPIYLAAAGSQSTKVAAQYSDGLITYLKPEKAKDVLMRFDKAARASGKNPRSLEKIAEYKIADPRKLQQKAKKEVSDEMLKESIQVTSSIEDCTRSIEKYFDAGFTRVYVHSTSPEEVKFVQTFCKKVLPYFMTSKREK
jgi:coenzyme F420-dependent glucose-6-phosphate dehydrogenase